MRVDEQRQPKPIERTRQEFSWALSNLRSACELWELNRYEQTENIATMLRLLIHDDDPKAKKLHKSVSLLTQLKLKDVDFFSTPRMTSAGPGKKPTRMLANVYARGAASADRVTMEVKWEPLYHRALRSDNSRAYNFEFKSEWSGVPFKDWWFEEILQADGHSLTRAGLIFTLAHRLGGAHSDQLITARDLALLENRFGYGFTNLIFKRNGVAVSPINSIYQAAVRQIAYELQRTIAHHFPSAFPPANVVPPLPVEWKDAVFRGTVKLITDANYDQRVMEQAIQEDGLWSGLAEYIRAREYWRIFKINLQAAGL